MSSIDSTRRPAPSVFAAALVVAVLAAPASAVVLPFTGTFTVEIGNIVTGWSGSGVAIVNGSAAAPGGHLHSLSLPPGAFVTTGLTTEVTPVSVFPIKGLQITASNGAGAFAEDGNGNVGGIMPIQGVAKVCLFAVCSNAVANVSVPLSVIGAGGMGVATGAVNLTVEGAPWTSGTAVIIRPVSSPTTRAGFAHGPASMTSSTAAPGGTLQLVTPIVVWTNLGIDQPSIFGFTTMRLNFVPEPATLALAAGGLALLAVIGRRRP